MYRRGEGPSYGWGGTFGNTFVFEFITKGHESTISDLGVSHQVPVGHTVSCNVQSYGDTEGPEPHMCLFMWRARWSEREKARSHRWHWKGR